MKKIFKKGLTNQKGCSIIGTSISFFHSVELFDGGKGLSNTKFLRKDFFTMKSAKILSLMLVVVMCLGMFASCFGKECVHVDANDDFKCDNCGTEFDDGYPKTYTYNTYVTVSPSNWNELTYQDNNDTEIMGWIGSSFFTYDFKYDANGEIIPGEFDIKYSAATKLEDVSAEYAEDWGLPEGTTGYAYKITLRDDLKWENGDKITAKDFVYSMKEQLNPLFQNYRADSYYNSAQSLVGAKAYAKQGQKGLFGAHEVYDITEYSDALDSILVWKLGPAIKDDTATPVDETEPISYIRSYFESASVGMPKDYTIEKTAAFCASNFGADPAAWVACEGKTLAEIKADPALKACLDALMGWWQTDPGEEIHACLANYTFPEASWDDVGIFSVDPDGADLELVIVFAKALNLLEDDGTMGYKAAYNMSSLPLVHEATYEACKIAPTEGNALWTSNYNSSVKTTMSWGPYKLASFQNGAQFTLVRNEYWYGYNMEENEGLYQTDKIVYDVIAEWNSAWVKFQAGQLDGIGIDVTIADDYKNSERAYFTPSDFVGSLQLQSSKEALQGREEDGINKTILTYADFRKALSLSINRAEYTAKCTTSSKAGFGLFNSMHYYDVANGGVFRNTDEAKMVLCNVYGVDVTKYESLDAAVNAITGYNLTLAKELVTKAYNEALAAGDILATDTVKLTFGTGAVNESVQRQYDFIKDSWIELVKGTPLEGRLELELVDRGTTWANDFRGGAYDVCMGGWTGAAWDPGYFLLAYLDKGYMYSAAWDTSSTMMEFTMKGVAEDGGDITETMSLTEWYDCLNGNSGCKYDWSSNALPESKRLQLIAALEEQVLSVYYTVPLQNSYSASLISYKVDYTTYEYNTFMGYGGVKYMTYNYCDVEWAKMVKDANNQINYK